MQGETQNGHAIIFDAEFLQRQLRDVSLCQELVGLFRTLSDKLLGTIEAEILGGTLGDAARAAHELAGAAGNIGAQEIWWLGLELELVLRGKQDGNVHSTWEALKAASLRLNHALEVYLKAGDS